MNSFRQKTFLILLLVLVSTSCSTSTVFTSRNVLRVNLGSKKTAQDIASFSGKKEFYLWGSYPSKHVVYVDTIMKDLGMLKIENLTISTYDSAWTTLATIFSLGMYTPQNFEINGYGVK